MRATPRSRMIHWINANQGFGIIVRFALLLFSCMMFTRLLWSKSAPIEFGYIYLLLCVSEFPFGNHLM